MRLTGADMPAFTDDAITAIADRAMERGTGARGLRAIIEEVLLHVMYDVPSRGDIAKVVITREVVEGNVNPTLIPREIGTACGQTQGDPFSVLGSS